MVTIVSTVYLLIVLQIVLHELGHVIAAKACGLDVKSISFGSDVISVAIGRIRISPICFTGYVEVLEEDLIQKGKRTILFFFESGTAMTMLISAICFVFMRNWEGLLFAGIGLVSSLINNLPFLPKTDMHEMIRLLKLM